jgi:phage-related protein
MAFDIVTSTLNLVADLLNVIAMIIGQVKERVISFLNPNLIPVR